MASGNLGDLFVSLGIKDEMSATLRKIVNGMKGVDQATLDAKKRGEDLIKSLNGINGSNFSKVFRDATKYIEDNSKGLANIVSLLKNVEDKAGSNAIASKFFGAKDLPRIAEYLTVINSEFAKMAKDEARADSIKSWQSRIANSLEYIKLLQDIDLWQNKIESTRSRNPNVNSKELDAAEKSLANIRSQIAGLLSSGGVDTSGVLGSINKLLSIAKKNVSETISKFKEENPLSVFSGGAAKVEADIARVTEKLAKMRDLMSEGTAKGYSTSMLGDNITELSNLLQRLQAALNNKSVLTDAGQMKNLLSDVALGMTKASAATQAYGREKGKVIAQEREHENAVKSLQKEWKDLTTSGFRGGRFVTPGSKEAAQGYLDIANAYKKAVDTLQTKHGEAKINLTKLLDEYNKEVKELESKIKAISPKMDGLAWNGKKLSPKDLAAYEELTKQLEHLKNTKGADSILAQTNFDIEERKLQRLIGLIKDYEQLSERVAKGTYKPYDANSYEQKRISETAALKNAIIERYNVEQEAKNKKKKDDADAERQSKANEKQRQTELENSLRRIQSMEKALANLQEKRFTSKMFGFDVSEADAKIASMKIKLNELYDIENRLGAKDMTAVGKLGNLGNGRETQAVNDLARSYDKANKEAQRGVDIEQKRQQEISKSAAKVQADLVRGFEKANSHAGKLNSTIQDLKSLFLQGGLVFGAQQFAMSIITTGGEMEKQHIALQSILGDMQNANTLFGQIKELALNSPFTFSELNRDVKQLAAYGVEYDQLYDTTKRLADMSSGLGVSFDRIALAFGQVQARGWLDGKELRQIAYAGIPLLDKLSDFYSKQEGRKVSTSEIKTRISNREVSFDDVKNIFWQMTDAGGQFYNMQQTLSETLLGRYNKLKDAWEIMLADFANGKSVVGGTFMFIINKMTDLVQLMHSFSPMLLGLFSGVAMKKLGVALAGSAASNFLSNKEKIAQDIKARVIAGQQLSQTEMRVLATKKQITREDLQALIAAKAITKTELQRLYLSGKISKEMYKQAVTSAGMNNFWTNFSNKGGVAISLLGKGIASLGRSLWTMIGGWPGLILTAVTASIGYIYSEYQDLSQKIKQTQDELADRNSQILSFLKDNNVSVAITKGDDKEIDNMIDAYKEKLKQLAPYDYHNLVMTTDEMKSHKDRLLYLEKELKLLKEANDVANNKMSNRSFYSDMSDDMEKTVEALEKRQEMAFQASKPGASVGEKQLYADEKVYGDYIEKLKSGIEKKFGDIAKDEKMRQAAMQSMSALFSSLGVPEDKADLIRTSILQAFGIGDKSSWLQTQVGDKMRSLIDTTFPLIGDKIKSNIPLTEAEKAKVKELMGDAKNGLIQQYPELERTLQQMLAASKFEAVIKLVVDGNSYNDVQSQLIGRIPNLGGGFVMQDLQSKYRKYAKSWGKEGSWYGARNKAKSDIDSAYNEYESALKSKASDVDKKKSEWMTVRDAAKALLYYDYSGEGKKSNKPPKAPKGRQEDSELKALQERLSGLKSARQMYQKYSGIMSDKEAADKTYKLFPEVEGLDLKDYQVAVRKLLDGFKINTNDRKKFQTSVYREVAEWLFSEKDKKEFDKKAADFTEQMNRLSDRWDLYKSILGKTGNKRYAEAAWIDAFQMDDKTKSLMDQYYQNYGKLFNLQEALNLSDGEAKEKFKGAGEYEAWKKIVDLLRGNYVKSLQEGADAMEKMASYADKIRVINKKYDERIKNQNDPVVVARMNRMRNQELGAASEEEFKGSSDYVNFYGAIMSLGMGKAQKIGENIRKYLNDALSSGKIDAREYAKELKLLNEQLLKLTSPRKTFLNGGLKGLAEQKIQDANEQYTLASSKIAEGMKVKNLGDELGDDNLISRGNSMIESGKAMAKAASILFKDGTKAKESLDKFAGVVSVIDQNVQGMFEAFNDVKETAALLGADTDSDAWQEASAFFETFSGMSNSISKVVSSAENGNIGGILSGTVGIFTSPIKSFAKAHDAKLDRQISLAERQLTELKNISSNISAVIEKTLGGIYAYQRSDATASKLSSIKNDYQSYNKLANSNFLGAIVGKNLSRYSSDTYNAVLDTDKNYSAYADQLALLKAQRDELQKQRNSEADKKKKDKDKLADYDQQLEEMGLQIKTFAQDFLKDIYSIDIKSWASELTDAVVGAWEKGEDAVDAYKEKVKDMVKDVTKNIVTQKIMEKALQKPLNYLTGILDSKGKLDETDMDQLADMLYKVGDETIPQITGIFDALKNRGLDLRENGSSSATNSIRNISEETGDLLASYVNEIRLDVSVDRENIKLIADAVTGLPELNIIAQSQLTAMNQLVTLAEYRNSKLDDMYSWMRAVTSGTGTKSIRMN